jgi:teichuronic acid biosynthesis glycosyltransferase TuaG
MVYRLIIAKVTKKLTYKKMLLHCFTGCSTVVYKQDKNNKIYGPIIKSCNDYALFLQVLRQMKNAMGLRECLTKYRIRGKSLSQNKFKKLVPYFDLMLNIEHKNIFTATLYLFTNLLIKYVLKYR